MGGDQLKFYREPRLSRPALVATWNEDAGRLGPGVADCLVSKLGGERFCGIEPLSFFPLGEVEVRDDVIQFPEIDFYACESSNLIVLKCHTPRHEWYRFLNMVLDVAEEYHVRLFYSVGGMVTLAAPTSPRRVLTVVNERGLKEALSARGFYAGMDFRTPPGGRPTLSSFLLWVAKRRNIPGANLWVEMPFYLAGIDDAMAKKVIIDFLNQRFNLGMDISEIDRDSDEQEAKIRALRAEKPEIDGYLAKLEQGEPLGQEEGEKLVGEIHRMLQVD